ncbi:MAG: hypothetical protein B6I24_06490 [Bacteroidetes bacterium 4572_128]|nr:MAG: hypothetical protein B6I24_06490 [Bacteroidetes bacterium 4572_128]
MKKFFKISFIIIAILIAILIAIPYLFKDKILEETQNLINENLNAKIEFSDVNLSIFSSFPDFNFALENVKVIGIEEFSKDTLVSFENFSIDLDLMSVISGDKIIVKTISLNNSNVNVKVLKNGKANYDIAKPSEETTENDSISSETKFHMGLEKFEINNFNLVYDDENMDVYAKIRNLNYLLKGDFTQDFTSLSNNLNIEILTVIFEKVKYLNKTKIEFLADIDADLKKMIFSFKENVFRLNELNFGFDGNVEMPKDDITIDLKFGLKKANFKSLLSLIPAIYSNDFAGLKTSGKLSFDGKVKGIYNEKNLPTFVLNLLVENAMFKYPDLPSSAEKINIDLRLKNFGGKGDNNFINLKKFHIELAKNPFDAKMKIRTSAKDVDMSGIFKGKIELEKLKNIIPLEKTDLNGKINFDLDFAGKLSDIEKEKYENFKLLGNLIIENLNYKSEDLPQGANIKNCNMSFSPEFVNLKNFDIKVGKSDFHLDGKIDNLITYLFKNEVLKANFNFNSNLLDANEFLSDEEAQEETTETDTAAMTAFEIPNNIDFLLTSNLKKVLYDNIEIKNILGKIKLKDSKASLENLKMDIFDGNLKLNGSYDAKNYKNALVDFDMEIKNFDIKKTVTTFNSIEKISPIAKSCSGKISTNFILKTRLDEFLSPILNEIDANGGLQSKRIALKNSNLFDKIADMTKIEKYRNPILKNINVSFSILDGVVRTEPFETKIGDNKATVSGNMKLDQTLNYVINLLVPRGQFGGSANNVLNDLMNSAKKEGINADFGNEIDLGILIKGKVDSPVVKLQIGETTKNVVEAIKEQAIDEAKKRAKEQANKILAKADKEAKKVIKEAEKQAKKIRKTGKESAKKLKEEGYKEAQNIEDKATKIWEKAAAKIAAKKLRKETDKSAKKLEKEANKQADNLVKKAKKQAENIKKKAKKQADRLLK